MGAAVAAGAPRREGVVDAIVLESPFADYRAAVRTHMDLLGLPGGALQRAAVWLAQRWSGADFAAVRPVDLLGRIACPVLAIVPTDDVFLPPAHERAMDEAVRARGNAADVYWRVEGAGHLARSTRTRRSTGAESRGSSTPHSRVR